MPSVAPEDLILAEEIGILTPKSFRSDLDGAAPPFVPKKKTWAQLHLSDPGIAHQKAHDELVGDIWLLEQSAAQDDHEAMLDEAAEWLAEQQEILWSDFGGYNCHLISDSKAIAEAEMFRPQTREDIKITKVFPGHSFASINGLSCVYLPWGSETNRNGPPGVKQPLLNRDPLREGEIVLAELEYHVHGRNSWRATSISKKLPTEDMLVSSVEIETDFSSFEGRSNGTKRKGFQYSFELPTDPVHIGAMIGKDGENINRIIHRIQKKTTKPDGCENPEVTITPIDLALPDTPFIPKKTAVRVFLPVGCNWGFEQVKELVSYFHS